MKTSRAFSRLGLVACSTALLLVASSASAQWVWKDDGGHVVASDQPPPIGVPPSRILKEPSARATRSVPAPVVADPSAPPSAPVSAPKSLADRELESRQREKEQAEAAKKADDEATRARAMQENCSAVRGNLAALQAGGRAARFNERGERIYIDDAQRQTEVGKSQAQVAQYCH